MSQGETGERTGQRGIDVLHVAKLCLLDVDAEELEAMRPELDSILKHIRVLLSVDTGGVEPSFGTSDGAPLRFREDVARPDDTAETIMRGVPCLERGFVKVPRGGTEEKGTVRE